MNNPLTLLRPNRLFAAVVAALGASFAFGAGFQLNENSGSGLGNAFAGGAAVAEDASTMWSNVAGISRLGKPQAVGVIHLVTPSIKFSNEYSASALLQPLGGNGGDAGGVNVVPNAYFAMPLGPQWSVGIGLNGPWGLVTEYDDGWIGRFQAMKSSIKTFNLNPGASFKVSDKLALGFGVNVQRIEATFTNQVNYSAALVSAGAPAASVPAGLESSARVEGNDTSYGWNAGLLWEIEKDRRAGVHYRSAISYDVSGDAKFTNPAVPPALAPYAAAVNSRALFNSGITSKVKLPPIVNLSYFGAVDSRWDVMVDAQWTGWSTIKDLTFVRTDGSILSSTPENFKDSWKAAIGANYRFDGRWMFRGGLAYDQSPVETAYRTPRLPDNDRTWLTVGAQFKWDPKTQIDFGAGYIWSQDASINKSGDPPNVLANGLLNGSYKGRTSILSAQVTYSF
jgi:long-chain fatty acid transport protein